jgi:amyloid beta precursor protein binding protein 1
MIHKHIPFAILLIKAAEQWRHTHNGTLPSKSQEKREFKVKA